MSAAGRALSKALESPDDWDALSKHRIIHRPTGMQFWVASGAWFFDGIEPDGIQKSIGLIERHWLYFKARTIRAKYRPFNPVVLVAHTFEKARAK